MRQATEAVAAKRTTLARLPDYMESLRDGDAPDSAGFDRDSLIATFGKDEGEQHWTRIEHARAFGQQMAAVRWAASDEIAEKLKAETDPDSPLHQAVARRNAQLSDKPADYVLKNPHIADLHAVTQTTSQPKPVPAVSSALQAAGVTMPAESSDENRRAAIAAYANASLAEQERLGVPEGERQVLPEAEAQDLVAQITAGDPTQADRTLRGLATDWGDAWPTVSADLGRAGLPGEYRLLAGIQNPAARQTFVAVLSAQAKEPGALRAKIGADADAIDEILLGNNGQLSALHLVASTNRFGGEDVNRLPPINGRQSRPKGTLRIDPKEFVPPEDNPALHPSNVVVPKAVPLFDDDGDPVMVWNPKSGQDEQVQIPDDVSLNYFARVGTEDRSRSLPERLARLINFYRSGIWDLQRAGLARDSSDKIVNFPQFVDVATIAIGVYAAAANIPKNALLEAESLVARSGRYGNVARNGKYAPLPLRNVMNTELGYYLYNSGKIRPK